MLSLDNPIVQADIFDIRWLAQQPPHPVFKLEGWGTINNTVDAIVIKQDRAVSAGAVQTMASTLELMSAVDPAARSVMLTPGEVNQLQQYVMYGSYSLGKGEQALQSLRNYLTDPNGSWFKMPVRQLLMLDSAVEHRLAGDKADVRKIALILKAPGGLEKLGEILSADLFDGQTDRFNWNCAGMKVPGGKQVPKANGKGFTGETFKSIQNIGNVFVSLDGAGGGTPIGLDAYDANGELAQMGGTFDVTNWGGQLLMRQYKSEREKFVAAVVDDLEKALGPRNRKNPFGTTKRLGDHRKERILNGMLRGRDILRNQAMQMKHAGRLNPMLQARIAAMGW